MRSIDACNENDWTIVSWKRADGENPSARPFKCRSWRHAGECRAWCGACDFARILHAINSRKWWTYCVLTYPRFDYPDLDALYRAGKDHWNTLRRKIVKRYGAIKYIQTWERHRSGWPHVNVVISSKRFQDGTADCPDYENPPFLQSLALESGFGKQCWAQPLYDREYMAVYLTKLGLELTGAAVKDQTPENAPPHFRRIRASRGLLPPRKKDDTITGQLFKMPISDILESMNGCHSVLRPPLGPDTDQGFFRESE